MKMSAQMFMLKCFKANQSTVDLATVRIYYHWHITEFNIIYNALIAIG